MRDIYSSTPVNKTASIVTSQSGCASDGTLSDEQKRANLVYKSKLLVMQINKLPPGNAKKKLGKQLYEIQNKINKIRPAKKAVGVERYFIDVARDKLTRFQFDSFMREAVKRLNESPELLEPEK